MVEIYLYGLLRCYAPDSQPDGESVVRLELQPGDTVGTLLERLGIPSAEICHAFLNGRLLSTRNAMAPWLGYQQVRDGASIWHAALDVPAQPGDRLGLFACDMALLVV